MFTPASPLGLFVATPGPQAASKAATALLHCAANTAKICDDMNIANNSIGVPTHCFLQGENLTRLPHF
jgi:hypothetical protein